MVAVSTIPDPANVKYVASASGQVALTVYCV